MERNKKNMELSKQVVNTANALIAHILYFLFKQECLKKVPHLTERHSVKMRHSD